MNPLFQLLPGFVRLIVLPGLWVGAMSHLLLAQEQSAKPDTDQMFESHQYTADNGDTLLYRWLNPESVQEGERYPLIIFLHGAGERGDDNKAQLKHGMSELCTPHRRENFPCFVMAPQCPTGQLWANFRWRDAEDSKPTEISIPLALTLEVVDERLKQAPIDLDRIYITGLSMGGFGTWDAIVRRPNFFAAAMPICGGGNPETASVIKHLPIACFHGAEDKVVPPERSRTIIEALRALGSQPMYVEYPGVGHNSWSPAYADDENWNWLFDQRLSKNSH